MRTFKLIGNKCDDSTKNKNKKNYINEAVCYNPNGSSINQFRRDSQFSSLPQISSFKLNQTKPNTRRLLPFAPSMSLSLSIHPHYTNFNKKSCSTGLFTPEPDTDDIGALSTKYGLDRQEIMSLSVIESYPTFQL